MAHSHAEYPQLSCPQCGATFTAEVWLIVDAAERPELMGRVVDESLHGVVCPNGHAGELDAPLLLYRPGEAPPLIFSPARRTTAEQDREMADGLIGRLRAALGGDWRDEWLEALGSVPRDLLPALMSGDAAALQAAMAEAVPPGIQAALAEIAAALAAEGVTLETAEDLDAALATRPELRTRLEAALREATDEDDEGEEGEEPTDATEAPPLPRALQAFIETPNWLESYRYLTAHPELLTDEADGLLSALLDEATGKGNDNAVRVFGEHRELLRRSRAAGAAVAFAEKLGTTPEQLEAAAQAQQAADGMPPEARRALEEVLAALAAEGVSVNSPEELERALAERPALRQKLEAALGGGGPGVLPEFQADIQRAGAAVQRYQKTGDRTALDEAAAVWERILNAPAFAAAPDRFQLAAFNNAGGVFLRRYWASGRLADLDRALALWQDAVGRTPADSPDRASRLNNLGNGLSARYARTGRVEDLDAAIAAYQDAVGRTPADSPDRASRLNNLGNGLSARYARTGRVEDLDAAIAAWQDAVGRTPADSPDRASRLNNLGTGLSDRYARTGRVEDLDAAIAAYQDAVGRTPADSPDRASRLNNLGNGLSARYARTGRVEDLDAAIAAYQDAVGRTPADSPDRASRLNNLGTGLSDRYARTGRVEDLDAAIAAYQDAVGTLDRALLNSPVAFVLGQQSRWAGLYARTVSALLNAGRPVDALAVAEGTKSRLLANLMGRGDVPAPPSIPAELAARERQAADRLRALDATELADRGRVEPSGAGRRVADRAAVVDELRAVWAGMEALGPAAADYVALRRGDRPTAAGLRRLAGALPAGAALLSLFDTGERVVLFLLRAGSAAPVVVEAVLDRDALRYDYLANYEDEVLNRATQLRLSRPLTHRWRGLGLSLLGGLLPHLDGIDHLVIAPEGIYHQLPLHALRLDEAGATLVDHCAVSYIPALGLLERLDHRPDRSAAAADLSGLSSVVMGYTDAGPETEKGARERELFLGEARAVAARLGVAPLLDGAATAAALEAATERPLRVLHLSCHGYFDVQDALASGVLLADGVYRARRFMDRRLAAELVTLSACQTGISGSLGGDEMAGLSMALLSAGAGALLLGLWSVSAVTTAFLMDRFYALLDAAEGKGATTAETLRRTMLAFRDGNVIPPQGDFDPADPYYWAPFVLVGNWR